jgi:hypothetical protein
MAESEKQIRDMVRDVENVMPGTLTQFVFDYIDAMLFSSTDMDSDEPLDQNYDASSLSAEFMMQTIADCKKFVDENYDDIESDMKSAAHDFWYTRNGHGSGFWDGDWEDEIGKRLTAASKKFKSIDVYVRDDGLLYGA